MEILKYNRSYNFLKNSIIYKAWIKIRFVWYLVSGLRWYLYLEWFLSIGKLDIVEDDLGFILYFESFRYSRKWIMNRFKRDVKIFIYCNMFFEERLRLWFWVVVLFGIVIEAK